MCDLPVLKIIENTGVNKNFKILSLLKFSRFNHNSYSLFNATLPTTTLDFNGIILKLQGLKLPPLYA